MKVNWIAAGLLCALFLTSSSCKDSPVEEPAAKERPAPPKPAPAPKYNVLLISLDTLRADHLGVYGYARETSPKIDAFAKRCVLFDFAYSHAPWTTPAHAAMLTSLYPTVLGLQKFPEVGTIADRVETMAEYFKANGYRTHAVTEGGFVHAQFGFDQGFEKYFQSARHVDHGVDEALKWIQANRGERFFFFYHTYDIHRYDPPEEYVNMFDQGGGHGLTKGEELAKKIQQYENEEFTKGLDEAGLRYIVNLYDASIRWVDRYVGMLLEYMEREGLFENTVVILTSDHGEEFLERGRTGHGYSNHEEQIRVPMMIYHPEVQPGRRGTLYRHIDLLPTLAEGLELQRRPAWLGDSLWSCIVDGEGEAVKDNRFNFCECGHSNYRSIQSKKWKLIDTYKPSRVDLYDLESDPGERRSVVQENEDMARRLKESLNAIEKVNRQLKPRFAGESTKTGEMSSDLIEQLRRLGYIK